MDFSESLKAYLETHKDYKKLGISIEGLNNPFKYHLNENELLSTASTMKVFVLGAVLERCEKGLEDLNRFVRIKKEEFYPGSGVIQFLSDGIELTVKDILMLMIILSDNSATNLSIDLAGGIVEVNKHIASTKVQNAYVNRKVYDRSPNPEHKKLAEVSAKAFTDYLRVIRTTDYFTKEYKDLFFEIMSHQQFKDMFGRFMPLEDFYDDGKVELMSKTGYDGGVRVDCGVLVLEDKREFAYAIMINGAFDGSYSYDNKAHIMMGEMGKIFFDSVK